MVLKNEIKIGIHITQINSLWNVGMQDKLIRRKNSSFSNAMATHNLKHNTSHQPPHQIFTPCIYNLIIVYKCFSPVEIMGFRSYLQLLNYTWDFSTRVVFEKKL